MEEHQYEVVRREFGRQASHFGEPGLTLSNRDYLQWIVSQLALSPAAEVLDVAAGTGHLSRAIAPHVRRVVAVDLTPEMLAQGRQEAEREGLTNLTFEHGLAEVLPYAAETFDLVVTRFSLHHFTDPRPAVQEMVRVCRRGGRVAIIDLISPDDPTVAVTYNTLERLRDPSHMQALTAAELQQVMQETGGTIVHSAGRDVEAHLERWMDLTHPTTVARQTITDALIRELEGGPPTGMRPFRNEQELMFLHAWRLVVVLKQG